MKFIRATECEREILSVAGRRAAAELALFKRLDAVPSVDCR